jgi:hypothetical protein
MHFTQRTLSALATVVVTASLAIAPALVQSASAAPSRAAVTQECADAQTAHALARSDQSRAHRKVVKAKKAVRKAKHTHRPAKVRKAKRHLKAAKRRYAARTHNERVQAARMGYACSAPNSSARAAGTGMKMDLLAIATGQGGKLLDPSQLNAVLEGILPTVTTVPGALSAGQLSALLSGFNSGTPSLDDLTVLLGGQFTPDQLQSLLGGSPDPSLVLALTSNIVSELSGLTSGAVPVPSGLDTTALEGIVTTVTGLLSPITTTVSSTTSTTTTSGSTLLCVLGVCL